MFDFYWRMVMRYLQYSNFATNFQEASNIAKELTIRVFKPIFAQLNPLDVGNDYLSLQISTEYGNRLAKLSGKITEESIYALVHNYPSHGFVINFNEAKTLFNEVKRPSEEMIELASAIGVHTNWLNAARDSHFVESLTQFCKSATNTGDHNEENKDTGD